MLVRVLVKVDGCQEAVPSWMNLRVFHAGIPLIPFTVHRVTCGQDSGGK